MKFGSLFSGLIFWVSWFILTPSFAQGQTLFSNLDQTGLGQGTISSSYYKAQKFTTDNNRYALDSVTVRLRANTQGNLFVKIYDDLGDLPNLEIASLSTPTVGAVYENHKLAPSAPVDLLPNQTYWVVAGVTSGTGDYDWNYTASNTGSGVGFSTRWAYTTNAGTTWTGNNRQPFIMEVVAVEPIPTLNEWGLLGFALLLAFGFHFMHRRKKQFDRR